MKKRRESDMAIGKRAYQEVLRLFPRMKDAETAIGCTYFPIYQWNKGAVPSAVYLARLFELGADISWILIGVRAQKSFTEER